jgi:hypothetical protein
MVNRSFPSDGVFGPSAVDCLGRLWGASLFGTMYAWLQGCCVSEMGASCPAWILEAIVHCLSGTTAPTASRGHALNGAQATSSGAIVPKRPLRHSRHSEAPRVACSQLGSDTTHPGSCIIALDRISRTTLAIFTLKYFCQWHLYHDLSSPCCPASVLGDSTFC